MTSHSRNDRLPKNITDQSGSVIGALVGMAGTLGLLTKWNIDADQAASFLGFAFMIAAAIRARLIRGLPAECERAVSVELKASHGLEVPREIIGSPELAGSDSDTP